MKLYWAPKTRSLRALWMLEEAGLPYELERIDIHSPERHERFLAVNPMGKVPALEDGEARLAELAAICAYVAEKAIKAGLAPALGNPLRGRYFHWLFFAPGCIEPAFAEKIAGLKLPSSQAGWGDFEKVFRVLDNLLAHGPWVLGENFSAADVMIGTDLLFGVEMFKLVEPTTAFTAYLDRCKARPALQRALAIDAAGGKPA